jgi:hypothetical protein
MGAVMTLVLDPMALKLLFKKVTKDREELLKYEKSDAILFLSGKVKSRQQLLGLSKSSGAILMKGSSNTDSGSNLDLFACGMNARLALFRAYWSAQSVHHG